jgi:colanic acid/amylovoran biosynthesis protein
MRASSAVGVLPNRNVSDMRRSRAILDISGGDSFTDLYGRRRFDLVRLTKQIALERGRPLVLLPQTYGPFRDGRVRVIAATIVAASQQAWARDLESYHRLQELLGDRFDPTRHRLGVDVAFSLPATDPGPRAGVVDGWLAQPEPVVGLNISGLLANDPAAASARFGLACDYLEAMELTVRRLLAETSHRIVLIPHVFSDDAEADDLACDRLLATVARPDRVARLPRGLGASETKHVISRLAWFAGARMHATIAALSTGVPAAAVAYSSKFQGVFAGCGVPGNVLDARTLDTVGLVEALQQAFHRREDDRGRLADHLPDVLGTAGRQFDDIVGATSAITRG